jgi:hypothetical protein
LTRTPSRNENESEEAEDANGRHDFGDHRKDLSDNHEEPESSDVENGGNSELYSKYLPLTPASSSMRYVARKDPLPIAPLCEIGEDITAVSQSGTVHH